MAGSPLLWGPRAGGVGLLMLLLMGLLRLPPALSTRPVKESRSLSAASVPLAETGTPRRLHRALPRGEAAGAVHKLAQALAHLLEAERQERARAEAQEAEDQQARVLAQLLRVWGSPRASDPPLAPDDDPDAPAAQLARALLRARLDPAALAAQLVPAPSAALRPRPPLYDDGPTGLDVEDTGDDTPEVDPELLRCRGHGEGGRDNQSAVVLEPEEVKSWIPVLAGANPHRKFGTRGCCCSAPPPPICGPGPGS
ncbi:proSAAS isoform X2 [Microtus oregoni]|uniref:proSAAS isoform X2 n=1 Tax=Microtus oregoni TaxID=111838 RepID=UPI001BB1B836|nr:proSAAS isoform X2 [Microtus oregoni]